MERAQGSGILCVVGTPIGNLGDASQRMVGTLAASNVILCEDTRVTAKLLAHFDIHVPLQRADEHMLDRRVASTIERVAAGDRVAFVSDAGMPGVSDPGQRLVDAVLDAGLRVEVVPGPSAVTCALVASGLPMERFFFEGFLPRKASALESRLRLLASIPGALVLYESPRRVAATLDAVARVLPQRKVALVRELTKVHEEVLRGPAPSVAEEVGAREALRGECVIVIGAAGEEEVSAVMPLSSPATVDDAILVALAAGEAKSAAARRIAKERGLPRSSVYSRLLELGAAGEVGPAQVP